MDIPFVFIGVLIVVWLVALWRRRKYYKLILEIPGPIGWPIIGMARKLMRREEVLPNIKLHLDMYGPIIFSWLGPDPFLVVSDPQIAEDVLNSPYCVNKGKVYDVINDGVGQGLFSSKNPAWAKHRKLLNPAFRHQILLSFMPIFNAETDRLLHELNLLVQSNDVNLFKVLQEFTLNVTLQTTMGASPLCKENEGSKAILHTFECILKMLSDMCFSPWLTSRIIRILCGRDKEYQKVKRIMHSFIVKLIKDKLQVLENSAENQKNNFIGIAIDCFKRGDFEWKNVIAESNVIISGAFETTSNTIFYTLMLLAMFPKYQQKAFEEIMSIFPDRNNFDVSYKDMQQMVYMDLVLNEVMRLLAPVPLIVRETSNDIKLSNGMALPKGVQIAIDIFHIHRCEEIWGDDANTFDPERFLNMEGKHPYAFIPFTKGIRNCIGRRYALMSIKTTLAKVLRNYRFTTSFCFSDLHFMDDITLKLAKIPLFNIHIRE